MKRKFAYLLIGASLLINSTAYGKTLVYDGKAHEYNLPDITLYVNNEKIQTTVMDPVSIDGRVLVPAREVFEPLGASVHWDSSSKKVIVDYKDKAMILTAHEKDVLINQETVQLDVPAKIINDKIMIPIRFVSENMGLQVNWLGSTHSVYVNADTVSNIKDDKVEEKVDEETNINKEPNYSSGTVVSQSYMGGSNIHYLDINAQANSVSTVQSVNVVEQQNKVLATINLSEALSDAEISVENGKVIIDIKNSKNNLPSSSIPVSNTYIERIRTSQFKADTTRVVFDLKSGAIAKAYTSNGRTNLVIELQKQNIEEVSVSSSNNKDLVYFKGLYNSQLNFNKNNNTISFEINNSYLSETVTLNHLNTNYITSVTLSPVGNNVKGTIYLNKDVTYEKTTSLEGTTLKISEVQETSQLYNGNGVICLTKESGISKKQISVTDNYRKRQMIIDLGGDYSEYFPTGTLTVGDSKVTSIQVTNDKVTQLIITNPTVQAININETSTYVSLELVKPSEKYSQIVVVDPGHGGSDSGAVAFGLTEKALNMKQAMAVYKLLEADPNIKVYTTREIDEYPTLQFRTALANEIGADLFVSFHNNSASASAVGTETLYYPSGDTTGKQVAQLIQNNIVEYCGMNNRGIKPRSDLYVLRTSNMPAVLIEAGFITNAAEANNIGSETFLNNFGRAVYDAIVTTFDTLID